MAPTRFTAAFAFALISLLLGAACLAAEPARPADVQQMTSRLDAPLLFVKRHSYNGIHIYDTFYKWPPGGGGIYVLENPAAPREQWKIRPVIDPTTPGTLGFGVYTHPELSFDATKLLFCFKGEPQGSTSIYEIGIDGKGLRRVTDPTCTCQCYKGSSGGQHDIAPAYLPDGRIVFLSTRPSGLVPCANSGVSILHVMNADGSDIHPISVNNVNEFDPSVLPDGRILFGRWEYVDKNALTIQSLWTVNPDGTQETAVFANNMVFPEAVLDARPVPGTHWILGTFAKHNSTPRGSIALIDPRLGKNSPGAIVNLEHPESPTCDVGDSCEPWPVDEDTFLFSGRPAGQTRNVLEMIDRAGHRLVYMAQPDICLHSPMLVKPRPRPPIIPDAIDRTARTGRFFLQDIYKGLAGVKRGEVKFLRVIEETSRVSPTTMGGSPYNQTFLVSAALAFSVKNYLGIVPVDEAGSAYFEVPAGRAVYLQALDGDGRLVQSMRTFVQAAPGATRSCIGCHEHKYSSPTNDGMRDIVGRVPDKLRPESWGSGYVDYPSMIQPILDRNCIACHGGEKDIAAGIDLTGGWTEHFSISYENLVNRRHTQLVAHWISAIDCMNGTALWSSQLFKPRTHGSGSAPLAQLLVSGHNGYIPGLKRQERDLLLAWIDSNGVYHGTWDYNPQGCATRDWKQLTVSLETQMRSAGCLRCHGDGVRATYFENDWVNLENPQFSRILRAPLPKGSDGFGLGLCRERKVDAARQRIHLLWKGYAHAVQPPEAFERHEFVPYDPGGTSVAPLASTADPNYQAMLTLIAQGRDKALANPRVDMPGAEVLPGACRQFLPPPLPDPLPPPTAALGPDAVVELAWERSARTIGLEFEIHRSDKENFTPDAKTFLQATTLYNYVDRLPPAGRLYYAIVFVSGKERSRPTYAAVDVSPPPPPAAPTALKALPGSCAVRLAWQGPRPGLSYNVYRAKEGVAEFAKLNSTPVRQSAYSDATAANGVPYRYVVRAVSLRGAESGPSEPVVASATIIEQPVFSVPFAQDAKAVLLGGQTVEGNLVGTQVAAGSLDLGKGGHAAFAHRGEFDLAQPLSLELWLRSEAGGSMPVCVSCGVWNQAGWFLQRIGAGWRWHVGGVDCDGGKPADGRWTHLVGIYDGQTLRLYQDGALVAEQVGAMSTAAFAGELLIGQYSGSPGEPYQVRGRIAGVKLYHRALSADEIARAAKQPPK